LPNVVVSFKIGPAQDLVNAGLAVQQSRFDYASETTDCSDCNSGSSRCGQEFGTSWSAEEKKALIEYLKALLNPLFRRSAPKARPIEKAGILPCLWLITKEVL
jgi:hypothetical protein